MQTIFIAGDSTVEDGHAPFFGWGGQLETFLPAGIQVQNHAKGGRSSKSFIEEERLAPIARDMTAGDLLLVAFGHNDEKDDPQRHTEPGSTFPRMLMRYVDAAMSVGATPVLVTSVCRRYFLDDGSLLYTHGEYPLAVRTLAMEKRIPLIDVKAWSRLLLRSLGPVGAQALYAQIAPGTDPDWPQGLDDRTHLSLQGARRVARMVAQALADQGLLRQGG